MKRIKKYMIFGILFFSFLCNVHAAGNPYPKYEQTFFGKQIINCTWYAWEQAHTNAGVDLPFWTYVQTWYSKAQKAGYSVGKEPKPNSIMVWDYGEGFGGHAAYVTAVNGDTVTFNEGGSPMTEDGIYVGNTLTMDDMDTFLVGFIYLDNVPKPVKPATPSKPVAPSKEETKPEKPVLSSNNFLSELTISGIDTNFQRDVLDYRFDVAYEVENITVEAKAEDSTAAIVGNGTFPLNVGENTFTITVTAADASVKEYHIVLNRKEEEKKIEKPAPVEEQPEEEKKKEKMDIAIIVGGTLIVVLILGMVFALCLKKKH